MTSEVTNVFVFLNVEIPDDIVFFGRGVHNVGFVLREVDQIDAILFGIERSLLGTTFAIINDNLIILKKIKV